VGRRRSHPLDGRTAPSLAGACQGLLETREISLLALLTKFASGAPRYVAASDAYQAQLLRTAMDAFVNNTP
jgi:hypothetical protein